MTTTLEVAEQLADELYGLHCDIGRLEVENAKLRKRVEQLHADQAHWELGNCPHCPNVVSLQEALEQNAKLREQMERLVTLLRVDCDIEASWDGLRKFWSIELTEGGCLMRDRVCKGEAENAKLRELVRLLLWGIDNDIPPYEELIWSQKVNTLTRELGVEVDDGTK